MQAGPRLHLILAITLGVSLLTASAIAWWQHGQPRRFMVVQPGVLYRSAALAPEELQRVIERYGIRTVVNLRSRSENREDWHRSQARICRAAGALLQDIPLEPESPPSADQIQTWLDLLRESARRPVLVHCKHGVVRTGMLVAIYQIALQRRDHREALRALPTWGHALDESEHPRVVDFILAFRAPSGWRERDRASGDAWPASGVRGDRRGPLEQGPATRHPAACRCCGSESLRP